MTEASTIREILYKYVPRKRWVPINDLFGIVQTYSRLDSEDKKLRSTHIPLWKVNVRHVLRGEQRLEGFGRGLVIVEFGSAFVA
jgi:hypothetical protein